MERLGICTKCGKTTMVRDHHSKGYTTDETAPYCRSCDIKAHNKARENGRCKLNHQQAQKQSNNSYKRRTRATLTFHTTMEPNVQLNEIIELNKNTGTVYLRSCFCALRTKELYYLKEK